MELKDTEDVFDTILIASKYGAVNGVVRGNGDQYNTNFFKSLRLQMGDSKITEPYKQHVWTFSCIKSIATAISSVPFVIIKEESGKKNQASFRNYQRQLRAMSSEMRQRVTLENIKSKGYEVIENGELYETFRDVNPIMTAAQLWEATVVNYELYGDCFWILDDGDGEAIAKEGDWPKDIWPFSPVGWEAIIVEGEFKGWKRKYAYQAQSIEKKYEPFQVIRFYQYNPYNMLHGLSTYDVVAEAASQDYKAMKYNEALLDNGGEPGGILTIPGTPKKEVRDALMAQWEDRHKGPTRSGKTALLMGGASYDRNPVTPKDMEYQSGRKWNRDETFAGYRTPKQLASIYEDINYATAAIQIRSFWENNAIPLMVYFEDLINSKLMAKAAPGYYCMFDLSTVNALREDLESKSTIGIRLNQIGIPTADIIDLLGINVEKKEWQKKWWMPFGLTPVDDDNIPEPEEKPPEEEKDVGEYFNSAMVKLQREIDKEKHWNIWVAKVLDPVEKPFQQKLKTYWYNLRQDQLKLWFEATKSIRAIPSPSELNDILFNNKEWQQKMKKLAMPFYEAEAGLSLAQAAAELGTPVWNVTDPRVIAILNTKANKITKVTDRFWNTLKEQIEAGISKNETVGEITTRIRDTFNLAASPSRTLTIARTETAQCASEVRNANFKFEGVKKHEWNSAGDEHVRPDHVKLGSTAAKTLDHNYMTDLGKPGTLMFPSDMSGPADQVINCRCVELPII